MSQVTRDDAHPLGRVASRRLTGIGFTAQHDGGGAAGPTHYRRANGHNKSRAPLTLWVRAAVEERAEERAACGG